MSQFFSVPGESRNSRASRGNLNNSRASLSRGAPVSRSADPGQQEIALTSAQAQDLFGPNTYNAQGRGWVCDVATSKLGRLVQYKTGDFICIPSSNPEKALVDQVQYVYEIARRENGAPIMSAFRTLFKDPESKKRFDPEAYDKMVRFKDDEPSAALLKTLINILYFYEDLLWAVHSMFKQAIENTPTSGGIKAVQLKSPNWSDLKSNCKSGLTSSLKRQGSLILTSEVINNILADISKVFASVIQSQNAILYVRNEDFFTAASIVRARPSGSAFAVLEQSELKADAVYAALKGNLVTTTGPGGQERASKDELRHTTSKFNVVDVLNHLSRPAILGLATSAPIDRNELGKLKLNYPNSWSYADHSQFKTSQFGTSTPHYMLELGVLPGVEFSVVTTAVANAIKPMRNSAMEIAHFFLKNPHETERAIDSIVGKVVTPAEISNWQLSRSLSKPQYVKWVLYNNAHSFRGSFKFPSSSTGAELVKPSLDVGEGDTRLVSTDLKLEITLPLPKKGAWVFGSANDQLYVIPAKLVKGGPPKVVFLTQDFIKEGSAVRIITKTGDLKSPSAPIAVPDDKVQILENEEFQFTLDFSSTGGTNGTIGLEFFGSPPSYLRAGPTATAALASRPSMLPADTVSVF